MQDIRADVPLKAHKFVSTMRRPKMPCLRCGCPWYSGEDWDALCMRCGWDCQISGYDDESQPLPPFRAQWQEFTAAIKEGRTPAYTGKRTKVRS